MAERFACPQCGVAISRTRYAPGTRMTCPQCRTVVELPYLTRRIKPRRGTHLAGWVTVFVTGSLALVLVFVTYEMAKARVRSERKNTLTQILLQVDQDVRVGRLGAAVRRLDAALALVAEPGTTSPDHAQELRQRRDELAKTDQENTERIALERAKADLSVAATLRAGPMSDLDTLLDLCERVINTLQSFDASTAQEARQKAEQMASAVVSERGVIVDAPRGVFINTPLTVFKEAGLEKSLLQILVIRGYLPTRMNSPLTPLWAKRAPFRFTLDMNESYQGKYMTSALDLVQITAELQMFQSGTPLWKNRVEGKTRQPVSHISARLSGILAVQTTRDPESERYLFNDAARQLTEQLPLRMGALPAWDTANPMTPGR